MQPSYSLTFVTLSATFLYFVAPFTHLFHTFSICSLLLSLTLSCFPRTFSYVILLSCTLSNFHKLFRLVRTFSHVVSPCFAQFPHVIRLYPTLSDFLVLSHTLSYFLILCRASSHFFTLVHPSHIVFYIFARFHTRSYFLRTLSYFLLLCRASS